MHDDLRHSLLEKKYGFLRAGSELVDVDLREQVRRLALQVASVPQHEQISLSKFHFEVRLPRH